MDDLKRTYRRIPRLRRAIDTRHAYALAAADDRTVRRGEEHRRGPEVEGRRRRIGTVLVLPVPDDDESADEPEPNGSERRAVETASSDSGAGDKARDDSKPLDDFDPVDAETEG